MYPNKLFGSVLKTGTSNSLFNVYCLLKSKSFHTERTLIKVIFQVNYFLHALFLLQSAQFLNKF